MVDQNLSQVEPTASDVMNLNCNPAEMIPGTQPDMHHDHPFASVIGTPATIQEHSQEPSSASDDAIDSEFSPRALRQDPPLAKEDLVKFRTQLTPLICYLTSYNKICLNVNKEVRVDLNDRAKRAECLEISLHYKLDSPHKDKPVTTLKCSKPEHVKQNGCPFEIKVPNGSQCPITEGRGGHWVATLKVNEPQIDHFFIKFHCFSFCGITKYQYLSISDGSSIHYQDLQVFNQFRVADVDPQARGGKKRKRNYTSGSTNSIKEEPAAESLELATGGADPSVRERFHSWSMNLSDYQMQAIMNLFSAAARP